MKRLFFFLFLLSTHFVLAQSSLRQAISLDANWRTRAADKATDNPNFEQPSFDDKHWETVDVPHNWDNYNGYRRLVHGNRHGYAWYRKTFSVKSAKAGQRYFLYFEGVGSYATVWLNGKQVGYHAGGRTTFTLDVTESIRLNSQPNVLAVRADHPAMIADLPWVCGGCSDDRGFSEGSQPMGIFRPVHLIVTNPVRIEPFGIHIWNDSTTTAAKAQLHLETEIRNYGNKPRTVTLANRLGDRKGKVVFEQKTPITIEQGKVSLIRQEPPAIANPHLWSVDDPYLYSLVTEVHEQGKPIDRQTTPYGIRWIRWEIGNFAGQNRFLLNGKPGLVLITVFSA